MKLDRKQLVKQGNVVLYLSFSPAEIAKKKKSRKFARCHPFSFSWVKNALVQNACLL